ncbi:MAG: hypothetical protein U5K29_13720 [Acidimicrobiales bacterium]|nr:hypothetical protein [Acidimicrobiales bacterium]
MVAIPDDRSPFQGDVAAFVQEIDPSATPAECRFRSMLITGLIDGVAIQREPLTDPRHRHRALDEVRRIAETIASGT